MCRATPAAWSALAPRTPAKLVPVHELDREIARLKDKVAVLAFSRPDERVDYWLRMPRDPFAYAHRLYAALRELDDAGCEAIHRGTTRVAGVGRRARSTAPGLRVG